MNRILGVFAMFLLTIAGAWADDYDPENPPDPNPLFLLTVSVSPSEAGYVSGGGRYKEGRQVWLSTSRRENYDFQYWTCDGVQVSDQASFYYTMPQRSVNVVAVYAYNPTNPQDPTTTNSYRLYLESNLEGSCTFNLTSGAKQNADQYISVSAQNVSPGFRFLGWYEGEVRVNENLSFWYKMPTHDATLTARFEYNPSSPDDPSSSQTDIDNTEIVLGDANGDGGVNVIDVVTAIDFILMKNPSDFVFVAADVDNNQTINIVDVVGIIDIILGRWELAPMHRAAEDTQYDQLQLIKNDDQSLSLCLNNQGQYVGAQFDLMLKDGQTLSKVTVNEERAPDHQISYTEIEPGFYRMLLFAIGNDAIDGQSGEIVNFKIAGGVDGARIENAQFVTVNREVKDFGTITLTAADIMELRTDKLMDIYTLDGRMVKSQTTTTEGLKKGIYIINNKGTIVK